MNLMVINVNKLHENIYIIKKKTNKEIIAVIKSNAYNTGARCIIKYLKQANISFFAFNTYEEYIYCQDLLINDKVLILDVSSYQYFGEYSKINDMYGNMMRIGNDNVIFIEGEHSKEIATFVVECLFGESAEISFYDDLSINGKSR